MPLKMGTGKATFSSNVSEVMHSYENKGTIGNAKPKSKKKALKMALAIAYDKQRKSK